MEPQDQSFAVLQESRRGSEQNNNPIPSDMVFFVPAPSGEPYHSQVSSSSGTRISHDGIIGTIKVIGKDFHIAVAHSSSGTPISYTRITGTVEIIGKAFYIAEIYSPFRLLTSYTSLIHAVANIRDALHMVQFGQSSAGTPISCAMLIGAVKFIREVFHFEEAHLPSGLLISYTSLIHAVTVIRSALHIVQAQFPSGSPISYASLIHAVEATGDALRTVQAQLPSGSLISYANIIVAVEAIRDLLRLGQDRLPSGPLTQYFNFNDAGSGILDDDDDEATPSYSQVDPSSGTPCVHSSHPCKQSPSIVFGRPLSSSTPFVIDLPKFDLPCALGGPPHMFSPSHVQNHISKCHREVLTVRVGKKIICPFCPKAVTNFPRHFFDHYGVAQHQCSRCHLRFVRLVNAIRHIRINKNRQYCQVPERILRHRGELDYNWA